MKLPLQNLVYIFFIVVGITSIGCGPKLASQQVLKIGPNDIRTIVLDATEGAQTVQVSAKSDGPAIKVFVYLSEDEEEVNRAITLGSSSEKIIASMVDVAEIKLSASIAANKEASVRIQGASSKDANVTLTITN